MPPAWVAAIIRVMVAPRWAGAGRNLSRERSAPPQCHGDALNSTWAPMAASPARWMSTGRGAQLAATGQRQAHLAHPAEQRRQIEHRAAHGPGEVVGNLPCRSWPGATNRSLPCRSALAPTDYSSARLVATSARGGTARRRLGYGTAGWQPAAAVRCFCGGGSYAAVKRLPASDGDKLHGYPFYAGCAWKL